MKINWPLYKKIGFLFLFFYFLLFANSFQFILSSFIEPVWQKVIPWFAQLVGHPEPITIFTNGSGDTTYNYYQVLVFLILAAALTHPFLFLLKEKYYPLLFRGLNIFIRYYLAFQMVTYGFAKLFYLQFTYIDIDKLDQPLGDFSPMGLLWTFMGYSKGYTMFTGALELLGGLLLLHRRTTTLGAIIVFGIMANVFMLNMFYDVPVKIFSFHLVLMSAYLISLTSKRLLNFFILNKPTAPIQQTDIVPLNYVKIKNIGKWVLIILFFCLSIYGFQEDYKEQAKQLSGTPFIGKHIVEDFKHAANGSQADDSERWITIYQSRPGFARLKTADGLTSYLILEVDTEKSSFNFKKPEQSDFSYLNYKKIDSERYYLSGIYLSDSISMTVKKVEADYELLTRGFRWINEYPYNR